jgi:HAMP domain-containing protein
MGHPFSALPNRGTFSRIPLRLLLVVPFVLQVSVAVGLTGWLSMRQGERAVNQVTSKLRDSVSDQIDYKLQEFLATSHLVNQINYDAIALHQLDPADEDQLFRHFRRQSQQFTHIDSIMFGSANGDFVGHTNLGQQAYQRMQAGPALDNHLQFVEVDPATGRSTRIVSSTPGWNTLTRPWYRAAVQAKGPVWGAIFPYHAYPVLALSASRPVYGDRGELIGVLGNSFFLTHISQFLQEIPIREHGQAFIMERSGLLIATSNNAKSYRVVDGQPQRVYSVTSPDPRIRASARLLLNQSGGDWQRIKPQQTEFWLDRERQFMQVATLQDDYGLDWLIVVLIPEGDLMAAIKTSRRTTVALCTLVLAGAIASGFYTSRWITRPLTAFSLASRAIAEGDLNQAIGPTGLRELEGLTLAFNRMVARLESSVGDLQRSKAQTERANAEIQQQAALFRLMAKNMSDLVCLHWLDGTISTSARRWSGCWATPPRLWWGYSPVAWYNPDELTQGQMYLQSSTTVQTSARGPMVCVCAIVRATTFG